MTRKGKLWRLAGTVAIVAALVASGLAAGWVQALGVMFLSPALWLVWCAE